MPSAARHESSAESRARTSAGGGEEHTERWSTGCVWACLLDKRMCLDVCFVFNEFEWTV